MENNENVNGQDPQEPVSGSTEPEVDYKALYEKLQKDNANLDKYNKDLKAKYQAKLTDDEKSRASQEERENYYKAVEKENKTMKLKSALSKTFSDSAVVDTISEFFLNDDINGGIQKLGEYIAGERANYDKRIKEASLLSNPTPPASNGTGREISQKEFGKMTYNQILELKKSNPDLYSKLTK